MKRVQNGVKFQRICVMRYAMRAFTSLKSSTLHQTTDIVVGSKITLQMTHPNRGPNLNLMGLKMCPKCVRMVVAPPSPPRHHVVRELEREIMDPWRRHQIMELWQETNRRRSGETGEALLPQDRLDHLIKEETSSCDGEGGEEDAAINTKPTHHFLRKEPNFALLSGVWRYVRAFTDGGGAHGDKMNVARLLDGAHVKVACRSRSTGRPATLRNSEAFGKRRFRGDHHQLMYVIAQVKEGQSSCPKVTF